MMKGVIKVPANAPDGTLTKEFLYKLCSTSDGMYAVPRLNDILYLHQKGVRQIGGLDEYVNVKCLYLQNNVIAKIENLAHLKKLTLLFLNDNCISKIENLDGLETLDKIDLSRNNIKIVENLGCLENLTSLDLSYNNLTHVVDIEHLSECKNVTLLRLSHNKLADPHTIEVLSKMTKLRALFLDGNPILGIISSYRKKVILAFSELCYLDDRPVKLEERQLAEAWSGGGDSAEDLLKLEMKLKQESEMKERHLKTYERMKARFPELYSETCTKEKEESSDGDVDQEDVQETIHPIKMPWENRRPVDLNDHAKKLVEEIEAEPTSVVIEEIPEHEEDRTNADAVANMPSCILEYMKEVEKYKQASSISSANETFEAERGMKSLPEELHFPINQRVEIWEDVVHDSSSDGEESDKEVSDIGQETNG